MAKQGKSLQALASHQGKVTCATHSNNVMSLADANSCVAAMPSCKVLLPEKIAQHAFFQTADSRQSMYGIAFAAGTDLKWAT